MSHDGVVSRRRAQLEPWTPARSPCVDGSMGRLLGLLAAGCVAALVCFVGSAFAGGTQVAVVAVAGRVWLTSGFDVVKLDAFIGRIMRRYKTRYAFPIEIGASDGNVWVSSVENGFVSGALTRIPFEGGRVTQPLVFPSRPLLSLAVGSGTTWALVGPWASLSLAAVDQATRKAILSPLRTRIGWIAADNVGDTPGLFGVTAKRQAVRLDRSGRVLWRAQTDTIQSPPAVGLGRLWVASRTALYGIDPASGLVETQIRICSAAAELAIGGGYLWMISLRETKAGQRYELLKIDERAAHVIRRANLPGPVGPISFGNRYLWMGRATPTVSVIRIDPKTLKERLFANNLG
jgi:hypothetical protein